MSSNHDLDKIKFYKEELQNEVKAVTTFAFAGILAMVGYILNPIDDFKNFQSYVIVYAIIAVASVILVFVINNKRSKNMKKILNLYSKVEKGERLTEEDFK